MFRIVGPTPPNLRISQPSLCAASTAAEIDAALAAGTRNVSERAAEVIKRIDSALGRVLVECRSATETVDVNQAARIITVIAVPWGSPAQVLFRGATWQEEFAQGAFDELDRGTSLIRVNRAHDTRATVGRVIHFDPRDERGLIAEIQIARTLLGDETLQLASEDCLSCSIAFSVPVGGEILDHRTRSRRITRATLDHIAMVENPAYQDALVLSAVG